MKHIKELIESRPEYKKFLQTEEERAYDKHIGVYVLEEEEPTDETKE